MARRWNLSPGRGKPPPWQRQPPKEPLSTEDAAKRTERRAKRQTTQKRAMACEDIAHNQLMARGFVQVRRIETGRTVTGKHVRAVDGDRTFLDPRDGRGGLAEVKSHLVDVLSFSHLEDQQWRALDSYVEHGAHAVLVWIGRHGIAFLCWRRLRSVGFGPDHPIKPIWLKLCEWQERVPWINPESSRTSPPAPPKGQ